MPIGSETYILPFSSIKKDAVKLPVEQYYNSQIQIIKNVLEKPMVTDSAGNYH
jgi:hypothetical protein